MLSSQITDLLRLSCLRRKLWYLTILMKIRCFSNLHFLARSPTISIYTINKDTIWIYSPYRIREMGVKLKSLEMRSRKHKKSLIQISGFNPFSVLYGLSISKNPLIDMLGSRYPTFLIKRTEPLLTLPCLSRGLEGWPIKQNLKRKINQVN